ncbi:MAG: M28 family peptidase [Nitrospinales bacterium]
MKTIAQHLSNLVGERNPFTSMDELNQAGEYISTEFKSLDLQVEKDIVQYEGINSQNILGLKRGSDSSNDYFVIGAHFDTVEGSPGADDNASAVAGLLDVARLLQPVQLKTNLLFAGFTLEEYGFIGSSHYANKARKNDDTIIGMISLEMLGFRCKDHGSQKYPPYVDEKKYPNTGDFIAIVGNEPSAGLTSRIVENMRQSVPSLPVESLVLPSTGEEFRDIRLSDHLPFWGNGYQAVMITDTAYFRNPNYHQPTDTLETLDIDFISDISAGVAGFLKNQLG